MTGVVIRDSEIGPCAGGANILVQGSDITIDHNYIHDGHRGVLASRAARVSTTLNKLSSFTGPLRTDACCVGAGVDGIGSAIEYDYMDDAGTIDGNEVTGSGYISDAVSVFRCSHLRLTNNLVDVGISYVHAAAFTIGDADPNQDPGHDNYASGNRVRSSGGDPPGVFGSSGNTVFERNCLTSGIQAYQYNGNPFVGVTVSNSRIGPGSYVPDTSVVGGWATNVMIGGDLAECAGL